MYESGTGMPLSFVEAYRWLSLALLHLPQARADVRNAARERLAVLEAQLTPAELAQARALVAGWRPL